MLNFKQYLTEKLAPNFAPWHITDPEKVQNFMAKYAILSGWKVNKDGTVTVTKWDYDPTGVYGDIGGYGHGETAIMVKYRTAKKFEINVAAHSNFKSLWGVPDVCDYLSIDAESLESLEHCTPTIKDTLFLYTPNLKKFDCGKVSITRELKVRSIGKAPLSDLHKHFDTPKICFFKLALNDLYRKPILSLLKCNAQITFEYIIDTNEKQQEVIKVIKILNEHNGSILACQEELMDNGLKEYAKL